MLSNVAVLYDIHGNLPALEAVLCEVEASGAEEMIVGGDVAPGPMAVQCLRQLEEHRIPATFIRGNGDREVCALARGGEGKAIPRLYRDASRWVAERLSPSDLEIMEAWPTTETLEIDGLGSVLFCHATPRDDNELFTALTPEGELEGVFEKEGASLVICGHTHMQFDRQVGGVRVVNAGSVGMPFGLPGAYWLRLGDRVELRYTSYNLAAAADRVVESGYPLAEEFAQKNVLTCPGEKEMMALFEAARSGATP